ncbi:MAG: hypothetical protein SNJ55_13825, partial [Chloroherpetonaceae bacterium]
RFAEFFQTRLRHERESKKGKQYPDGDSLNQIQQVKLSELRLRYGTANITVDAISADEKMRSCYKNVFVIPSIARNPLDALGEAR